jgi:hypothetical protein
MLLLPRTIQALACCAGACLQSFCTWGNFNRRKWGFFNRRKLGNIQLALTIGVCVYNPPRSMLPLVMDLWYWRALRLVARSQPPQSC